jgi:basic amino acid/polyamine antiporter, APA family
MRATAPEEQLKRELGVWAAVAIVIGTTIGSGIFLVPKTMIREVETPAMVFTVWILGGVLSLFGALTYAELAARFPEAGGEYVYLREAYGRFWGFTYGWLQTWVARSGSAATLATGFFVYLTHFFPALDGISTVLPLPIGPDWKPLEIRYGQILAIGVLLLLGLLNTLRVRLGAGVQIVLTAIKVALILGVIAVGFLAGHGNVGNFAGAASVSSDSSGFLRFFAALVAALWAYDGWNTVAMVGSEVKDPERNMPRALIGGILGIIAVYLLANAAYFYVLTPSEAASGNRIAAEMMEKAVGATGAGLVSVAAMISMFAALNGTLLGGSRIPFAMARDGLFFAAAGKIDPKEHTPAVSIWLLTATACILVLSGRYEQLFTSVVFSSWILYAMAAASVFVFRSRDGAKPSGYRAIGYPWVPGLFVATALVLLAATLLKSPRESILGLGIIAIGVPFYLHWSGKSTPDARND